MCYAVFGSNFVFCIGRWCGFAERLHLPRRKSEDLSRSWGIWQQAVQAWAHLQLQGKVHLSLNNARPIHSFTLFIGECESEWVSSGTEEGDGHPADLHVQV